MVSDWLNDLWKMLKNRNERKKWFFINQRKIKKENKQTILTATICYSSPSPRTPTTPTTPGGTSKNGPLFSFTDPALAKRASTVKEQLLQWAQMKTKEYEVENWFGKKKCVCVLVFFLLPLYHLINCCRLLAIKIGSHGIKISVTLDISFMVACFLCVYLTNLFFYWCMDFAWRR